MPGNPSFEIISYSKLKGGKTHQVRVSPEGEGPCDRGACYAARLCYGLPKEPLTLTIKNPLVDSKNPRLDETPCGLPVKTLCSC